MADTHRDHYFPAPREGDRRWADPETLARLETYPCLQCLSDKQLWIVATMVLCAILQDDCTVENLVSNSGCVDCYSERQMWQILVGIIAAWATDNGYIDDLDALIQQAVCLNCLEAKRIRGILISIVANGIVDGDVFPTP